MVENDQYREAHGIRQLISSGSVAMGAPGWATGPHRGDPSQTCQMANCTIGCGVTDLLD